MMVWDPSLEKYLAFGSLKTAALGTSRATLMLTKLDKVYDSNSPRPCC